MIIKGFVNRPDWATVRHLVPERMFNDLQKTCDHWCRIFNSPRAVWSDADIIFEVWNHKTVAEEVDFSATFNPKFKEEIVNGINVVAQPPRRENLPLVFIRFDQKYHILVDGRHRAYMWREQPGLYGIIVIEFHKSRSAIEYQPSQT